VLRASAAQFEQVIVVAGHVMAFGDFGDCLDASQEGSAVFGPIEDDRHKSGQRIAHRRRIHERRISFDDTALFEAADTIGHRGRREADKLRQVRPADAAVPHQPADYFRFQ